MVTGAKGASTADNSVNNFSVVNKSTQARKMSATNMKPDTVSHITSQSLCLSKLCIKLCITTPLRSTS